MCICAYTSVVTARVGNGRGARQGKREREKKWGKLKFSGFSNPDCAAAAAAAAVVIQLRINENPSLHVPAPASVISMMALVVEKRAHE